MGCSEKGGRLSVWYTHMCFGCGVGKALILSQLRASRVFSCGKQSCRRFREPTGEGRV